MSITVKTAAAVLDQAAATRHWKPSQRYWHTEVDHNGRTFLVVVDPQPDPPLAWIAAELLHVDANEQHSRQALAAVQLSARRHTQAGTTTTDHQPADELTDDPPPRAWCARSYHADRYGLYAFVFRLAETNTRFTVYTRAADRYTVGRTYTLTLTLEPGDHRLADHHT